MRNIVNIERIFIHIAKVHSQSFIAHPIGGHRHVLVTHIHFGTCAAADTNAHGGIPIETVGATAKVEIKGDCIDAIIQQHRLRHRCCNNRTAKSGRHRIFATGKHCRCITARNMGSGGHLGGELFIIHHIGNISFIASHHSGAFLRAIHITVAHRGAFHIVAHQTIGELANGITGVHTVAHRTAVVAHQSGTIVHLQGAEAVAHNTIPVHRHERTRITAALLGDKTQSVHLCILRDFRSGEGAVINTDGIDTIIKSSGTPSIN